MSLEVPEKRLMQQADTQDLETLEALKGQKHYYVTIPYDPEQGYRIATGPKEFKLIARDVSINGIQFLIPANERTLVPKQVLDVLMEQTEMDRERFKVEPGFNSLGVVKRGAI